MAGKPIAVVDVGSNSGRVVVLRLHGPHVEILADARAPLRLAAEIKDGRLRSGAIDRTVAAMLDFRAVAQAAGATRIAAVATSAVREASNGMELIEAIASEVGIDVEIIDGEEEARFSFLGAVYGLSAENGCLVDIGGGSVEISRFKEREMVASWTLPLGALRLSRRFLTSDPPTADEVTALRSHAIDVIEQAGIGALTEDEGLIGTGGTIRNLAKIDRREQNYPIPRVHGYVLTRARVDAIEDLVVKRPLVKRRRLRGLNADRADSIIGGILALQTVMEALGGDSLTVSGQGLREGIAYDRLGVAEVGPEEIRRGAVEALVGRFSSWQRARASRRWELARGLLDGLLPDASDDLREMLEHATTIVDIGQSIDYYNREDHAADIVISSDLTGFSHTQLATVALIIKGVDVGSSWAKGVGRLLEAEDADLVQRAAVAFAFADDIERRLPPGSSKGVACSVKGRDVIVSAPVPAGSWLGDNEDRFRLAYGKRLRFETAEVK